MERNEFWLARSSTVNISIILFRALENWLFTTEEDLSFAMEGTAKMNEKTRCRCGTEDYHEAFWANWTRSAINRHDVGWRSRLSATTVQADLKPNLHKFGQRATKTAQLSGFCVVQFAAFPAALLP